MGAIPLEVPGGDGAGRAQGCDQGHIFRSPPAAGFLAGALEGWRQADGVLAMDLAFTFDPAVKVGLEGVRWPLTDASIDLPGHPSISNEAVGDRVTIGATGGAVVVVRNFRRQE